MNNYPEFEKLPAGRLRAIIAGNAPEDMKVEARAALAMIERAAGFIRAEAADAVKVSNPPPVKSKRKQQGREETQVHRDVRAMILGVKEWERVKLEEEYPFQLCEGHSYTVDFRFKWNLQDVRVEAKGPKTWNHNRVKFLWCMTQLRWAFFVWAKQHKKKNWTFEVWHAGSRLKMKGKRQNPRDMAEVAALIESESNKGESEC